MTGAQDGGVVQRVDRDGAAEARRARGGRSSARGRCWKASGTRCVFSSLVPRPLLPRLMADVVRAAEEGDVALLRSLLAQNPATPRGRL